MEALISRKDERELASNRGGIFNDGSFCGNGGQAKTRGGSRRWPRPTRSCIAVAERLQLPVTGADRYWSQVGATVEFLPFR